MTRARGISGQQAMAHVLLFPVLCAGAYSAWRIGFPDICALMGVFLMASSVIYEITGRMTERRSTRRFGETGKTYAIVMGLASIYIASDAYVLEQAWLAYPADGRWFGALLGSLVVLGSALLVRRSGRTRSDEIFVARPRFTGLGVALFVTLLSLQLIAMAAVLPWWLMAAAYRLVFCAAAFWIARFGAVTQSTPVLGWGLVFLWLGIMTAYLDLLWPFRETWPFLAGAGALGLATAFLLHRWGRRVLALGPRL
jgi:hypothetical protein